MDREFNNDHTPLAYFITFRSYGTWMHGDERGSVDRHHRGYDTPMLPPSPRRELVERRYLKQKPVKFNLRQRQAIAAGIRESCAIRKWNLWSLNVRTNHLHCVLTANYNPKRVTSTLKANATRAMRSAGCWRSELSPWARGGSAKYLWNEKDLKDAIEYVEYGQGLPLD